MGEEYSNQTLHEILIRIEAQCRITNGTVKRNKQWIDRAIGALIITNVLLVPVVIDFIKKILS